MSRVLLIDDHRALQVGLRELLSTEFPDAQIEFADSDKAAIEQLSKGHWDVAVVDINLRGVGGLDLIPMLKHRRPQLRVLVYTMHPESQFGLRAFRSGADGFLSKDAAPEMLFIAIRQLLSGRKYLSPELAEQIAAAAAKNFGGNSHESLSAREYEVLQGLATGKTLTELAHALDINIKTVSTYRSRICEKVGAKTQADLVRYAIRHGIVQG
jgi:two-component system, NarL family, invasion response regulator UvrY